MMLILGNDDIRNLRSDDLYLFDNFAKDINNVQFENEDTFDINMSMVAPELLRFIPSDAEPEGFIVERFSAYGKLFKYNNGTFVKPTVYTKIFKVRDLFVNFSTNNKQQQEIINDYEKYIARRLGRK